ncbi:uncharacterized protein LOC131249570 [Magnolia sinica]|uniref:uncharacterized protein LOC131249570 n=1 Tax=Magnolia sinica TaxID=86752 RepID=UPI0026597D82|nr:uncharacterized protein LOC131249570 [Magnolia sinica]
MATPSEFPPTAVETFNTTGRSIPSTHARRADASLDPTSPYYLHNSDNLGTTLVSNTLTGDNYSTSSRVMRMTLSAKNKLSFIDKTIPKLDSVVNPGEFAQWQRYNDMVLSWILNSVAANLASSPIYTDSASELKGYWDELASYSLLPSCTCGVMKILHDRDQEEKVLQFLMRLHDSYVAIRGHILLMNPLPSLNMAYALVLQKEKQREIANSLHNPVGMALAVNRSFFSSCSLLDSIGHGRGKGKERTTCDHCRDLGLSGLIHSINQCYQLHGYPLGHCLHKAKDDTSSKGVISAKPSSHNANKDKSTSIALSFTQDLTTRTMIGLGKEVGGLYLFNLTTSNFIKAFAAHYKASPHIWHQRLRHPSHARFQHLTQDPHWCEAMDAELAALDANGIWTLVDLPPGR